MKGRNTFYALRNSLQRHGRRRTIRMHRVILRLTQVGKPDVDHINRNGLDNRRINLRIVSRMINCQNHIKDPKNTSGYNGISWHKTHNKWQAYIKVNYKLIFLGYHKDIQDAINARKQGELKYWDSKSN